MATDICTRRLTKELKSLMKDPIRSPTITVAPNEKNILEVHYVIEGSEKTPFAGGIYHGKLLFPKDYPLKPPSVIMITKNGRFQPNRRLCLSMSDFHPEVSYTFCLSLSSVIIIISTTSSILFHSNRIDVFSNLHPLIHSFQCFCFVSFQSCHDSINESIQSWNPMWSVSTILTGLYSFMIESQPTLGSIESTKSQKEKFARQSLDYNVRDPTFCKLFPEYVIVHKERLAARQAALGISGSSTTDASNTMISHESSDRLGGNDRLEINGLFATAAGLIAVFSIMFAMRFL